MQNQPRETDSQFKLQMRIHCPKLPKKKVIKQSPQKADLENMTEPLKLQILQQSNQNYKNELLSEKKLTIKESKIRTHIDRTL